MTESKRLERLALVALVVLVAAPVVAGFRVGRLACAATAAGPRQ
ncbi:MAG TPA: hypothetical protein VGJ86_06345 [Acidimicrobiales bacterium]|jgi:hypothetical protein